MVAFLCGCRLGVTKPPDQGGRTLTPRNVPRPHRAHTRARDGATIFNMEHSGRSERTAHRWSPHTGWASIPFHLMKIAFRLQVPCLACETCLIIVRVVLL